MYFKKSIDCFIACVFSAMLAFITAPFTRMVIDNSEIREDGYSIDLPTIWNTGLFVFPAIFLAMGILLLLIHVSAKEK